MARRFKKSTQLSLTFLSFSFLLIVLVGWIYHNLNTPFSHQAAEKTITIEPGLGTRGILVRLSHAGVISNRIPLLIYITFAQTNKPLQAGDYQFASPITPLEAIKQIQRGQVISKKLTIPEGFNIYEIDDLLKEREFKQSIDNSSLLSNSLKQTTLISDITPLATSLEGYLFPDTYTYSTRTTDSQLVSQMVRHFKETFTPEMQSRAQELGFSIHQVITLASLIEKEAKVDEDRSLISSVFHNRLKKGMKLECDPTFIYAAILENKWDGNVNNPIHKRRISLYNTYVFSGLPPGPIASPGLKSITAALYPAQTENLYFVLSTGGKHRFSRTETEHRIAVSEYRKLQQGRDGN